MVQTCRGWGRCCSYYVQNVWEWVGWVWYISNYIHIYIFYCEPDGEGCVSIGVNIYPTEGFNSMKS